MLQNNKFLLFQCLLNFGHVQIMYLNVPTSSVVPSIDLQNPFKVLSSTFLGLVNYYAKNSEFGDSFLNFFNLNKTNGNKYMAAYIPTVSFAVFIIVFTK